MNTYQVPVDVYLSGFVKVTARTEEEAVELAQELEAKLEDKLLPTKDTVLDIVTDTTVTGMLALEAQRTSGVRSYRTAQPVKNKVGSADKPTPGGVKVRSRRLREKRRDKAVSNKGERE